MLSFLESCSRMEDRCFLIIAHAGIQSSAFATNNSYLQLNDGTKRLKSIKQCLLLKHYCVCNIMIVRELIVHVLCFYN